jgi:hypothetical protein
MCRVTIRSAENALPSRFSDVFPVVVSLILARKLALPDHQQFPAS